MKARVTYPSTPSAAVMIALCDVSLKVLGLRRTMKLARRLAGGGVPQSSPEKLISRTARTVARAAAFHPGRAQCLEQSIVLYVLLRRRGVEAQLRLGVRPVPFSAHAWVEHAGRPVNETEDFIVQLAPFPSLGV